MNQEGNDDINQSNSVILNISETEMIRLDTICRLCANQSERIIGIYSEEGITLDLAVKMNLYLPVKVAEDDTLPLQCCWSCASTVLAWHELVIGSVEADRRLRELQIITSKDIIESVEEEQTKIQITSDFEKGITTEKSEDEWNTKESEFVLVEEYCYSDSQSNECGDYYEKVGKKNTIDGVLKKSKSKASRNRRRKTDIMYNIFCDVCNKGYTRQSDMERHRKTKHSNHLNTEPTKSETKAVVNGTSEITDFSCRHCEEKFERRLDLKVHVKSKHGVTRLRRKHSEITAEYFCDVCDKGFTRKHDMKKHRKVKHPTVAITGETENNEKLIYLRKLKVTGPDSRSYYKCDVCKRIFKYAYNLLRHQTTHTKVYGFVCHICAKRFPSSGGLRRHLNEHHFGVKKFSCEVCGKSFAANATREEHMNIHTNNRPFVCDLCGKAFKQKASLRSHKLFHTNDFKFSCNFCDKKFRRAYELKTHTWTHTGHRPHRCHLCGSTFRLGQDLKRHLKVHDKLGECTCDQCGATFSQQKYLNNHKRSHKGHSKANPEVVVKSADDYAESNGKIKVFTIFTD